MVLVLFRRVAYQVQVVPRASAIVFGVADAEAIAIPANHLDTVKFASREDGGYERVSGHLQILVEEAPDAIDARWKVQGRIQMGMNLILVT